MTSVSMCTFFHICVFGVYSSLQESFLPPRNSLLLPFHVNFMEHKQYISCVS